MKTLYALFISLTIAGTVSAQQSRQQVDAATAAKLAQRLHHPQYRSVLSGNPDQRFGPTDAILAGPHAAITSYYIDPIFVDSTVTTKFGSAAATHVQTMKAGGMFDPTSTLYPSNFTLPSWEPYTVDTIWVAGEYNVRTSSANAHDTLQLEVSWGYDTTSFFTALSIPTPAQKWLMPANTPSVLAGNKCFSTARASNAIKLKHVLTVADTVTVGAGGANWPYIPFVPATPISVPAGGIVSVQYTYINKSAVPSNKVYYVSPTNTATMNSYMGLLAADTSGVTHNYFYDSTSYGASGVVDVMSRYGKFPTAQAFLNGVMLPQTEEGYLWELSINHSTLVTATTNLQNTGLALYQNIPNPFNGISEVGYELATTSDITFSIYDLTGRVVSEKNYGKMEAGRHTITLNAAEFGKGVYFYTLRSNGVALSKKMIITE
jgi:hypothetical protein